MKASDKVVCLDDRTFFICDVVFPCGGITKGAVYCVDHVLEDGFLVIVGKPAKWAATGKEFGWSPNRFRELAEQQRIEAMIRDLNEQHAARAECDDEESDT